MSSIQDTNQVKTCGICYEEKQISVLFNLCTNEHPGNCAPCISNWYESKNLRECTYCRQKLTSENIRLFNNKVEPQNQVLVTPTRRGVIESNTPRPRLNIPSETSTAVFDD